MSNKIFFSAPARLHSIASHLSNNARSFTTTLPAMSSSSKDSKPNYTGLTPAESKALPSREARPEEASAIATIQDLYKCKPTEESYKSYTPDAIFHDPVGIAKGIAAIKAQFNALPALFPRADITKFRILDTSKAGPSFKLDQNNSLVIDQVVDYYRKPDGDVFKSLNSLLSVETQPPASSGGQSMIKKHVEEWDHKEETDDTGFLGTLNESRKKITAKLTEAFASQTPPTERKD